MKLKTFLRALACAALALLAMPAFAITGLKVPQPDLKAESYVLLEALTGEVVASKNPDMQLPPASLAKMMTAYLGFAAVREGIVSLDEDVVVSSKARAATGSRMFLEVNSSVSFRALLLGLIVQSGNDAAIAIAERIGGTEEAFVDLMNQQAANLGMTNTTFGSSTGLPRKGQVATALDLAVLARRLAIDFPELYKIHSVPEFEHNGILQRNRNKLLDSYLGADGLKTGYTRAAGYCLAASAVRSGMRLVGVVLKSKSTRTRAREMEALFNYGFNNFRSVELFAPGQSLDLVRVWGGAVEKVEVGYGEDEPLRMLLTRSQANELKAVLKGTDKPVEAPVARGDKVALIEVTAGEEVLASLPAVALAQVETGPWWVRMADYVRLHWLVPKENK